MLLDLPAWKWASIVEGWAWQNVHEDHRDELRRDLERRVDFTWARTDATTVAANIRDPAAWQTNKPGETLLSGRKKRRKDG